MRYLYLHGFASSPQSTKAQTLKRRFQEQGMMLEIPDLNQHDFSHLTLTRQIEQARAQILQTPAPVALIGSSLGGLTAAWLAEQRALTAYIQKLILLAPAFQFLAQWLPRLGTDTLRQWQIDGTLPVYHHGEQRPMPLDYGFMRDAQRYDEDALQQPTPTLILHGRQDEVISIQASRDYAASRPWVKLVELDSDHTLGNVQEDIWQHLQTFLEG